MSWRRFWLVVGMLWCSPITILGGLYVSLFSVLGWYDYSGWIDHAWFFVMNKSRMPRFLVNVMKNDGHCIGNIIVMKQLPNMSKQTQISASHELARAEQYMRLGVFLPFAYRMCSLVAKLGCPRNDFYDNPFEIDARRAAGQIIDVSGMIKKLRLLKK